jgi:penicillin-binding protein 1B
MRTRLAIAVLVGFVAFAGLSMGVFGWYGYRVYSELSPGSWRSPTRIIDRNGQTIASLYGTEWRVAEPVVLSDLPEYVPNAFLAAEDSRFRSHIGIDPIGIGRAAVTNVVAGGVAEGGSTITQQLAKTRFLSAKRTFTRKWLEAGLALMIELRLSKDEILEAYLNEVYLGHRDGREVRGLGEASRIYFGKTPAKLTPAEAALIAGMIRAPNRDNPDDRSKIARQRRDAVLGVMLSKGWIDKAAEDSAIATDAEFHPGKWPARPHPFLLAALKQEFIDHLGKRSLTTGGLSIYTAVDLKMQAAAERAVQSGTRRLRANHGFLQRKKPLQAALLSVEPLNGGIRALVGGSDFARSQFDRTRLMKRQPGSAAKAFTYAAAIEARSITPSSMVDDSPIEIQLARNKTWSPKDYDQRFRGPVTAREAFEKSLNVPAVRVASTVGVDRVQEMWHNAGISGTLSSTPAIALGVDDVTMRELVEAYSIFPNLGTRSEPHLIERVTTGNGSETYRYESQRTDVLDPAVAYVMHSMMRGVVLRGTAARLNSDGLGFVAGKTGTTSNYRDAWFVGYTPDVLTAVWVGFDDGTPLRISSGEAAVPIFAAYMSRVPADDAELNPPSGVTIVQVEAATGRMWQQGCGPAVTQAYLSGTEPREPCGGYFDGSQIFSVYEEPPMISEDMAAQMYPFDTAMVSAEVVQDPDEVNVSPEDTVMLEPDTVPVIPRIAPPVIPPPVRTEPQVVKPPVTSPPVSQPPVEQRPVVPPPVTLPAPRQDTATDSLSVAHVRPQSLLSARGLLSSADPRSADLPGRAPIRKSRGAFSP